MIAGGKKPVTVRVVDYYSQPLSSYDEGREFAYKALIPSYDKAISEKTKLIIDLDGQYGYPSTFLNGAFGTFASLRNCLLQNVVIKSDDQNGLIKYIQDIFKSN